MTLGHDHHYGRPRVVSQVFPSSKTSGGKTFLSGECATRLEGQAYGQPGPVMLKLGGCPALADLLRLRWFGPAFLILFVK